MPDTHSETAQTTPMIENRRKYVRVDDYLPMRAVPVEAGDVLAVRERLLLERNLSGAQSDTDGSTWHPETDELLEQLDGTNRAFRYIFERLDYKLDLLLQLTARQQMAQEGIDGSVRCDMSGGGIRFESATAPVVGQPMQLQMYLRDLPPTVIKCLGEVVRVEDNVEPRWGNHPYRVSVKFTDIVEADRERIIRYVFGIQRHLIRNRNSEG